jgi:aspartate racemase
MSATKSVGVMGGLGPAATCDFLTRLLDATQADTDQDHLRVLVDNDPRIPDRNAALRGEGPSPGPALARMARGLAGAGAEFLVLACNAAHAYESEILAAVAIPFLSMIDETVRATLASHPRRVGLLAADACLQADLYGRAFAKHGVETVQLDATGQTAFMQLLYRIKSGERGPALRRAMHALALELAQRADVLVAGCTEVPLVLDARELELPFVSSTDVLVERTIRFAGARLRSR